MAIKDKNGIEPSRLTNKYGSDVLRVVDKNGNTLYRQQQEIVYSAKVKTQGAWVNIDDYLCSAKTVVKFKLFVPKNVPVLPDYGTIIGRSRNDSEFFWFAWQNNTSTRFAYYVKNKYQSWLPYPAQAFDKLVNIEMSCNNIIVDDVVFAGNPSDYVAPENGIQIFASKKGAYLDYIMGICGITIGSNIEIYDKQDDGSLVLKRNLYFVPAGDTQHSAIPAPVGGACWCRVTNRYYNVLQNDGVGELEFEPISVNKNPRTEYSVEVAETGAYFDIYDFQIKDTSRFKFKYRRDNVLEDGYNTLLGNYQWATNGIWLSTGTFKRPCWCYYVSSEKVVNKLIENTLGIDIDIEATVSNLKFNGINVVTTNMTTFNNPSIGINIFQDKTFGFPSKPDGGMFKSNILFLDGVAMERELIPVPEGDIQYSDIPAPKGGALWDRVTNKYYAKQGTGTLKFRELPRLGLKSSGTQYIDTGIIPNGSSSMVRLICTNTEASSTTDPALFVYGSRTSIGDPDSFFIAMNARETNPSLIYSRNGITKAQEVKIIGNKLIISYLPKTISVNFMNTAVYSTENTRTLSAYLFSMQNDSGRRFKGYVTAFEQYDAGILLQNLIPVKQGDTFHKKDSTPAPSNCMYDTVTDTYFENAGTGTFEIVEENPYYNLVDGTELFKDDKTITEFNYDTPYLTNATNMFANSSISNVTLDTSNCITTRSMFTYCHNLKGKIPLFDLSNCNDTSYMFYNCANYTGNVPSFNLIKCKKSGLMFAYCYNIVECYINLPITVDINSMFINCVKLVRGPSEYPLLLSAKDCFLNCALPKEEIVRLIANLPQFTGTPDATSGQGYITFTGCPGCASMTAEDWKVGEDKGWVVER